MYRVIKLYYLNLIRTCNLLPALPVPLLIIRLNKRFRGPRLLKIVEVVYYNLLRLYLLRRLILDINIINIGLDYIKFSS